MDSDLGRQRGETVQEMVDEPAEIVRVSVEARLEPLVPLAPEAQPARRQVEDDDELPAGALVERAFLEARRVGREPLTRRRDELRGDVDPEVLEVRPSLAAELEHDAGAAADVEHRAQALEQLERFEARGMLAPFVAHAEKIADLGRREAPPGFFDPHRLILVRATTTAEKVALIPVAPFASRPRTRPATPRLR